jgi:SPP1 family phage portal protein
MKTVKEIFALNNTNEIVKELTKTQPKSNYAELEKEYNPSMHDIFDKSKRPDKFVQKRIVEVARIGFNYQKKIVNSAVSFLFSNPVKLQSGNLSDVEQKALTMIEYILDKNKAYSLNRKLARTLFKETEVAEYWYPVQDADFWKNTEIKSELRLRVQLFSQSKGDKLYPYFNEYGDMIAFSREYQLSEGAKTISYIDTFTKESISTFKNVDSQWQVVKNVANPIDKIPIIYYSQDEAEWADVQSHIDRSEKLVSNFADTNDYFGSPMIKVKGMVKGLPEKGESGKVITLTEGGEAEYLTWSQAPESIKTEYEILRSQIFAGTNTPNLSFENLQNLGNIAGITLKLMFLDAHLKAQNKLEVFDEAFARRLSIIKSYCSKIQVSMKDVVENVNIWFVITPFLPENTKELYENLSILTGGKQLISQKTAVGMTGIIENVDEEIDEIKKDNVMDMGESFV